MSRRLNELSHSGLTRLWPRLFGTAPFFSILTLIFLLCSAHQVFAVGSDRQTVATGQVKILLDKPVSKLRGKPVNGGDSGAISANTKKVERKAHHPLVVRVIEPTNLNIAKATPLKVKGTVSDPTAKTTVNGVLATNNSGIFQANIPLQQGVNTILVVAEDTNGQKSSDTVTVSLESSITAKSSQTSQQSTVIRTSEIFEFDLNHGSNTETVEASQYLAPITNLPLSNGGPGYIVGTTTSQFIVNNGNQTDQSSTPSISSIQLDTPINSGNIMSRITKAGFSLLQISNALIPFFAYKIS